MSTVDVSGRWRELLEESIAVRTAMFELLPALECACDLVSSALRGGRKLILVGNGGSGADAQHIAAEFVGRFILERQAFPAIALSENLSSVTGISNDYSFDKVFSRQIEALADSGDVLIALSTSGTSVNVVEALKEAHKQHLDSIGVTGVAESPVAQRSTLPVIIPAMTTASIQEGYMLFLHAMCGVCEGRLAGSP